MNQTYMQSLSIRPFGLEVVFRTGDTHTFSWLWLLDNSQDPSRYNTSTSQRRADHPPRPPGDVVQGTAASLSEDGLHVQVQWADGSPQGIWPVAMLAQVVGVVTERVQPLLWSSPPDTSQVSAAEESRHGDSGQTDSLLNDD